MNELKSPATFGDWFAAPTSDCTADARLLMSAPPPWSNTSKVKPPIAFTPGIDGGMNGTTIAPWTPNSGPRSRATTSCSECSRPRRSAKGLSEVKIIPWFGALPLKLKPITENTDCTSGVDMRMRSTSCATLFVYSSDEPAGACTTVSRKPLSSSGTNACGTRV